MDTMPGVSYGALNVTVDRRAPDTTVESSPRRQINAETSTFECFVDEIDFESSFDCAAFEPCQVTPEYDGLSNGGHTFKVRVTDALGNAGSASEPFAWTVEGDVTASTVSKTRPANRAVIRPKAAYTTESVHTAAVVGKTGRIKTPPATRWSRTEPGGSPRDKPAADSTRPTAACKMVGRKALRQ